MVALATGLDRRRWNPAVIGLAPEGALVAPLRQAGIPTTCLGAQLWRPARAALGLVRALRRHRPALVQSFLFHANLAARLAAPLAGSPWVVAGLRVAEREKRWHLALDRWTQGLTTGSVCVSRGVERYSRDEAKLPGVRLTVIPNGVDPVPFDAARVLSRAELGLPEESVLALGVGRLERQKGWSVLLDAMAAAPRSLCLAVVGQGPDGPALQARCDADSALRGRVRWLGPRSDIPSLLASSDLLVLASFWEGMPNVVLEAMAARRAVVATRVEGCTELVVPGETGWLVPPGDSPALAVALAEAATDAARRHAFGQAGRRRVESRYTLAGVIRAYDRLWSRLLGFEDGPYPTPSCGIDLRNEGPAGRP